MPVTLNHQQAVINLNQLLLSSTQIAQPDPIITLSSNEEEEQVLFGDYLTYRGHSNPSDIEVSQSIIEISQPPVPQSHQEPETAFETLSSIMRRRTREAEQNVLAPRALRQRR